MPGGRDGSGASTLRTHPRPTESLGVRYKRHVRLGFPRPRSARGAEKGEHLEGRSRGLGRLGGTSALSRARAPLGAGASRAAVPRRWVDGHNLRLGKMGLPSTVWAAALLLYLPLPGVSPIPCFLLGKPGAGVEIPGGGGLWGGGKERRLLSLLWSHWQRAGFSSQGQAILSVRGHWAGTASGGPGSPP